MTGEEILRASENLCTTLTREFTKRSFEPLVYLLACHALIQSAEAVFREYQQLLGLQQQAVSNALKSEGVKEGASSG